MQVRTSPFYLIIFPCCFVIPAARQPCLCFQLLPKNSSSQRFLAAGLMQFIVREAAVEQI
jgi:hypothetical protein